MYKNEYICSIHCRSMEKNDVEVIEYGSEIQINQKHLEKIPDIANIADRTQHYSSEFKKSDVKYRSVVNINPVEFLLKILWQQK